METANAVHGLGRYFKTARHLKPLQLLHWVRRRTLGRSYAVPQSPTIDLRLGAAMADPVPPRHILQDDQEFRFLNVAHRFAERIDWDCPAVSKLWRYNLHYFDYTLDTARTPEWVEATIADWIAHNPPEGSDGWEPYPVSLRIVNWIKFALSRCPREVLATEPWLVSLYQQLAWLERNVEKEILANHILKNAKALVFGGAFFAGPSADRWLKTGLRLLLREAEEQVLDDGGHYERSLMYHAIVVEDLLDVLNISLASPELLPNRATELLKAKCLCALKFLEELCYPDGKIPLFNDAAFDIAPDIAALLDCGSRLIGYRTSAPSTAPRLIDKPQTGYFGYRAGEEMLLVDAGPLGPDYQPGHGHCDLLSFELVLGGQRVVVDSGVFSYENNALRHVLRGTAAHNTVRLDGEEQSDIWSSFRVGRRARPGKVTLDAQLPERFYLSASHDGYRHLSGRPLHERSFDCDIGQRWVIADRISGSGDHLIESFLHIHPDIQVRERSGDFQLFDSTGGLICRISVVGGEATFRPSIYCPEFGLKTAGQTICIQATVQLPAEVGYIIECS